MTRDQTITFSALLALCILVGFASFSLGHSQASQPIAEGYTWQKGAQQGWQRVAENWGTETPAVGIEWADELLEAESMEGLKPDQVAWLASNHGFMVSCALLMFIGLFGFTLLMAATPQAQPFWIIFLRNAGIGGLVITAYFFYGFNLSYPWEFSLAVYIDNILVPGPPGHMDPISYGFMGLTPWSDAYYQAAYTLFGVLLLASYCSTGLRTVPFAILAIVAGVWIYPIVCSWNWGGGWLSDEAAYDFAGAGVICFQAGAFALPVALGLAISRRRRLRRKLPPAEPTSKPVLFYRITAAIFLLLLGIGWISGSVLEADGELVAGALKVAFTSCGMAALTGVIWGFVPGTRSPLELGILSGVAGLVMISAAADIVALPGAMVLGVFAGCLVAPLLLLLDSLRIPDPIGALPVFFVCGFFACLVPALDAGPWFHTQSTLYVQMELAVASSAPGFILSAVIVYVFSVFQYFDRDLTKPRRQLPPPLPVAGPSVAAPAAPRLPLPTASNPNPAPYGNRPTS